MMFRTQLYRLARTCAVLAMICSGARLPAGAMEDPAAAPAAEKGRQRFQENCAICHGVDARGAGPFVLLLKKMPPDLTRMKKENNGYFPFDKIYEAIDGRKLPPAHGTSEMPIWGRHYKTVVPEGSETMVRGRILELVLYLRSIQVD